MICLVTLQCEHVCLKATNFTNNWQTKFIKLADPTNSFWRTLQNVAFPLHVFVAISASLMYFLHLDCFCGCQYFIMLSCNRNRKQFNIGRNFTFGGNFSRFDIYLLPASNSQQRLQSFLISSVIHIKSFVTFVHACLDGATHINRHF